MIEMEQWNSDRLRFITNYIIVIVILVGNLGCVSHKATTLEASKAMVAGQFEKWKRGEANFFDLLADDVTWVVSGKSPVSGTYKGKKDFMERAVNPITAQLQTSIVPELVSLTADEQYIWLHWNGKATTITGSRYENNYVWKLQLHNGKISNAIAFLDTYELALLMNMKPENNTMEETKGYIGMWVTVDGYIRHELLPNNRYDEARGTRKSAYQGSYQINGNRIDYQDDTGFTADGEFRDGVLYHAGMVLYKENK